MMIDFEDGGRRDEALAFLAFFSCFELPENSGTLAHG
jgi:hypothetical protein